MLSVDSNQLTITSGDIKVTIPYDLFALAGQQALGKVDSFQKLLRGTATPDECRVLEQEQIWMPFSGEKTGYQLYLNVFGTGSAYLEWDPQVKQVSLGQLMMTQGQRQETRPRITLPRSINLPLAEWIDTLRINLSESK